MLNEESLKKFMPWTIVAGGSEGVGACFAERLAKQGVNLVLVARKPGPLEDLSQSIRNNYGVEVRALSLDLAAPAAADTLISECSSLEVGGLIYNAGASHGLCQFLDQPLDDFMSLLRLNAETQVRLIHHLAKGMRERGAGAIISLGSGASSGGTDSLAGYSAAKAYSQCLMEGLWHELRPFGVDVLCLILGLTRTPAMARAGFGMDSDEFKADEPDDAAATGLAKLGQGPVHAMDSIRPNIERLKTLPRAEVVESLSLSTQGLSSAPG